MSTLTANPDVFEFLAGFDTHRHLGGQPTPYHRRNECREIIDIDPTEHFLFTLVTTFGLGIFSRIIDIANTKPLISKQRDLFFHLRNLEDEIPQVNGWPEILVAIVLTPEISLSDLKEMFECRVEKFRPFALKIFPAFRSPHGIDDYSLPEFRAIMKYAEDSGIPLICHAEVDGDVDGSLSMEKFAGLVRQYPMAKFVLAHTVNRLAVETVIQLNADGHKVLGQINPQHALCTAADYFQHGIIINPFLYMNPPFESKVDAFEVRQMMLFAKRCFALGSDSVAKTIESKESKNPSAGIFWPPEVLYSVLISTFEKFGDTIAGSWRMAFNRFVRTNAEEFFGLQPIFNESMTVCFVRRPWTVPDRYPQGLEKYEKKSVVPFMAGKTLEWSLEYPY